MASDPLLQAFLVEARCFLEQRWRDRAIELQLTPEPLSSGMCGFSVGFLLRVLPDALGGAWSVRGGVPMSETGQPLSSGGIRGADDRWHGHYWLHDVERKIVVDLTADQFGHDAILVVSEDDPRYDSNFTRVEIEDQLRAVAWRAAQWSGAWRERNQRPGETTSVGFGR